MDEKYRSYANAAKAVSNQESAERDISARERMLREAIALTTGDRNKAYGPPTQNMQNTANMFNAYLQSKPMGLGRFELTAEDICVFMIVAKLARLARTPSHVDSWTDIAAYSGMGHEATYGKQQKGSPFENLYKEKA